MYFRIYSVRAINFDDIKDGQSLSYRYQNRDGLILYKQGTDMYNTYAKLLANSAVSE